MLLDDCTSKLFYPGKQTSSYRYNTTLWDLKPGSEYIISVIAELKVEPGRASQALEKEISTTSEQSVCIHIDHILARF